MRRFLLLLALFFALPVCAKSLHWRAVDVAAHLEADGSLRIRETQQMVFDGDWNGGERGFNLRGEQELDFRGISRVDGGRVVPLTGGDLDEVDRYDFNDDGDVLRWRSRMPDDPPFAKTELAYVLDYSITNVLTAVDDRTARLAHDFLAEHRTGAIERFTLRLTFDPVWSAEPVSLTRADLSPGETVVVTRDVRFTGAGSLPVDLPRRYRSASSPSASSSPAPR